ncbi:Rha family transcriptional regulator [Psychrobacillus sp. NPDC058041]|uniref:Rha family transcriptional regulator n=1 Tax=Psychrobacillus sp. NPDC058041 TaxID=3346310 RepID=UPI0036DA60F6
MNQLKVLLKDGQLVTDSRDVAEMIEQNHKELLRTIRGYSEILGERNFAQSNFFIESWYVNSQNKSFPCYLLTKKGCDMVANKMTGEKGVLFTAAYVTRFEEMEKAVHQPKALSEKEQLKASMRLSLETSEEVEVLKVEVNELKEKVDNQITIDHGEQCLMQQLISKKVSEHAISGGHKRVLFPELYGEIKNRFGVSSYRDVKRNELQTAIRYIESWIPRKRNLS